MLFFLAAQEEIVMFREMRRKKQALPFEECTAYPDTRDLRVLALSGDGGYPYAVPMSYVYDGEKSFSSVREADISWTQFAVTESIILRRRLRPGDFGSVYHIFPKCDCIRDGPHFDI